MLMNTADAVAELVRSFGSALALLMVGGVAAVAAAGLFTRSFLVRLARQSLDKELETHKQQLQLEAAALNADHDRRLKEFDLYTRERHRAYAGVYKRFEVTHGAINHLWGFSFERTYEDATREDIEGLLKEKRIPGKTSQEILLSWDRNSDRGRELLAETLREWKHNAAHRKMTLARNYQILNELYFSDDAASAIEEAYQSLVKYWVQVRHADRESGVDIPQHRDLARAAIARVRDVLRREMQRGDGNDRTVRVRTSG